MLFCRRVVYIRKIYKQCLLTIWTLYPTLISFVLGILSCQFQYWEWSFLFFAIALIYTVVFLVSMAFDVGFVKRLTDFFVEVKIPFMRRSVIFQKPSRKALSRLTCREVYARLRDEKAELPKSFRQNWTYLAITHQTVITHLLKVEGIDEKRLNTREPDYQSSLWLEQKSLTGKRCRKCSNKQICHYRKKAKEKRPFYWIQFHTKSTEQLGARNTKVKSRVE